MLKNQYNYIQSLRVAKAFLPAILCLLLCIACAGDILAQSSTINSITQNFDEHRQKALQEKLFLHVDRPVYACGETMWFKVYNVDGTLHKPLGLSRVAYVEVLDVTQRPVLQAKVALKEGTGNGSFVLPATLSSGNYKIRAYTNWMKNFSPEFFFEQPITIVNTLQNLTVPATAEARTNAIQFFPEGGNMVAGVENKVAFKAVEQKTGKGIDFTGELYDQHGNKVTDFKPHKFGIGHFTFTPALGNSYTAKIKLSDNQSFVQALPKVYEEGYALRLEEADANRLRITISQIGQAMEQIHLLGHTRQMIALAESATISNGTATFLVDKAGLAEGITHFTVFNSQKQPVCERLYFKQPTQSLQLSIAPDKPQYGTREKVTLDMLAQAGAESAVSANVSLAVYRLDSLQGSTANCIESYLWLTSDLKGTVESPGYYFSGPGKTDKVAQDNLMLTHGWSRFKWENILSKEPVTYDFLPELNGHWVTGRVTHISSGNPAPGITTYMASPGKHIRLYNSKSDTNGLIRYEVKDFFGKKDIVVQSDFTKDSTYHFEIFSPFADQFASGKLPVFQLSEALQHDITLRHVQLQVLHAYHGNYTNIFRSAGVDSIAFYGKAAEQYKLDDYKRFKVMEEVMREYVPGVLVRKQGGKFNFKVINRPYNAVFQKNPMVLLDGVPVFDVDKIMAFDPLKINKLDVVTSRFFSGPLVYNGVVSYTTYDGDLAGFELDSRALMQEYEGLQLSREFYAPSYETQEQKLSRLADLRNLMYWAPELHIKEGKEKVDFYTSDQVGTYLVVVQGITNNGLAGSKTVVVKVEQPI